MPQDVVARDVVLSPRKQRHEPAPWNAELDPREQRFIELFIETNNGTRSALAAGYGRNLNTAGNIAHGLLRRPDQKCHRSAKRADHGRVGFYARSNHP